jgi:hypothetical protein
MFAGVLLSQWRLRPPGPAADAGAPAA